MPNIFAVTMTRDNFGIGFFIGCKEQRLTKLRDDYCKDTCGVIRIAQFSWESNKNDKTTISKITITDHLGARHCAKYFVWIMSPQLYYKPMRSLLLLSPSYKTFRLVEVTGATE